MKIKDKIWAVLFKRERLYDIVEPLGDIEPDERTRSRIESWRLIGEEGKMYTRDMEGAKAVIWKAKTLPYGDPCYEDEEEIEYKPCCPTCEKVFPDEISITKYCPDCGTKLWRHYCAPEIEEAE